MYVVYVIYQHTLEILPTVTWSELVPVPVVLFIVKLLLSLKNFVQNRHPYIFVHMKTMNYTLDSVLKGRHNSLTNIACTQAHELMLRKVRDHIMTISIRGHKSHTHTW